MTLSRRGFLGGLAALLSLLVWPWKKEEPAGRMVRRTAYDLPEPLRQHNADLLRPRTKLPVAKWRKLNEANRDRTTDELWELLSNPPTPEEFHHALAKQWWKENPEPTHFQGFTKRYT